jgi:glutamine synthetase
MLSSAARSLRTSVARSAAASAARAAVPAVQRRTFIASSDDYGTHLFSGEVADSYLSKQGLPAGLLNDPSWTETSADKVAAAVMEWAHDKGGSVFTHWFQPLGATSVRPGMSGQVHNAMFTFDKNGKPNWELKGSNLLKGETDGSSYPTGGMRATHTAGGYTIIDPTSPIFLKGDTIFIPTVFVSFYGHALDEKTPLLRSMGAVSKEATRLLKHLGYSCNTVNPNIGLEQEFFLVPRKDFYRRPDLQLCGRTLIGKNAPRGQELCDHYMAPINQVAMACMQEIQHECFMMGIPLRTRHREVAPNQYEFAPFFGTATTQIDQNLMVMQVATEVAARHGLACLMEEKPFAGINGSGKHNNFSLGDDNGVNLLNPGQLAAASGSHETFPVIMAALVRAIDKYGDLMRMSIASPGNDFRLGACEAPPAIVSTYLGDDLTNYLDAFRKSKSATEYKPDTKQVDLGIDAIKPFTVPAEDRNRTSPFPYGGHRFEFRAVGSSQNVSMVNTVLCTIFAESFAAFSDAIEKGAKPAEVAAQALDDHWRVIFNGDGYSEEWPIEAGKRGVTRIDSGVESMAVLSAPKNVELFESMNVMSKTESEARTLVMFDHYAGTVEMEALTMLDMMKQHVIPSAKNTGDLDHIVSELDAGVAKVQAGLDAMHHAADEHTKAQQARVLRLEIMEEARAACDKAEENVPADLWTLATYKELLFLDGNQGGEVGYLD